MLIHTASEGISFAKAMETAAAEFYEDMAASFEEIRALALANAEENRRFARNIQRVYQEVITDAIEGSYCFQLETANYELPVTGSATRGAHDAIQQAIAVEGVMIRFYSDARDQADTLMADIPRAFGVIVRKRKQRQGELKDLSSGQAGK
ncbi:MAG: hypothetical protein NTY63_04120 [Candidatus Bipolaricaulota bacterium]|nr:hypothetical protein [Candidatus Bipolaricaulota bacterium]